MINFDDLFDRFFGRNRKKQKVEPKKNVPKKEDRNDIGNDIGSDFVDKLMKSIKDMENFNVNFGPPTKVEYYESDGVYYKREIWKIDGGEMVHLVGSMEPFTKKLNELSYDEQLAIALENEDYETAAQLRDLIKKDTI